MPSAPRPAARPRGLFRRGQRTEPSTSPAYPGNPDPGPVADRVVVDGFLDRDAADRVARVAGRTSRPLAVDVTHITGFDSRGLAVLLKIEHDLGPDRVWVQGLEEATVRLVGLPDSDVIDVDVPRHPPTQLTTLNRVAVVSLTGAPLVEGAVADSLRAAAELDVVTVVVDLLGAPELPTPVLWELAEVSAEVRLLGHQVMIVNASAACAEAMAGAAMTSDVFVGSVEFPG